MRQAEIEKTLEVLASSFSLKVKDLLSHHGKQLVSKRRGMAYLALSQAGYSSPDIARMVGRENSVVRVAINTAKNRVNQCPVTRAHFDFMNQEYQQNSKE